MTVPPCDDADCAIAGQPHPKCTRHRKRREAGVKLPCGGHRIRGLDVCRMHAGVDGATARAKGERRLALGRAMGEAGRLMAELGPVSAGDADAEATILETVARARQMARLFDELVAGLEVSASVEVHGTGAAAVIAVTTAGVVGPNRFGELTVHPYVELQRHWNAEAAKVAKAALDAGISERQMQLAESHVRAMAAAFRSYAVGLVDALVAAGMDADRVRAVVAEQAPALMRRSIEAARAEEA